MERGEGRGGEERGGEGRGGEGRGGEGRGGEGRVTMPARHEKVQPTNLIVPHGFKILWD